MQGKVFGIGFQKTGTSSLREALRILGYRVKDATPRALVPILKKDYPKIKSILDDYDAAEDTPWFMIYKELDELYPGSKFILTERDAESWFKSVSRHIGNLRSAHHEWIYGRGKGIPSDDKEHTISVFNRHNEEVRTYFQNRPNDLIVLNFRNEAKWEPLCEFLGKEIPGSAFPHFNEVGTANIRSPLGRKLKYARKQLKQNLKMKYLDIMGYW